LNGPHCPPFGLTDLRRDQYVPANCLASATDVSKCTILTGGEPRPFDDGAATRRQQT